jgi:predicted nucleotidyltransferase
LQGALEVFKVFFIGLEKVLNNKKHGKGMKYKAADQKLVDRFVTELVGSAVNKFPEKVDFAILYGSAARGEFVKGVSDIDLLLQAKDAKDVEAIKKFLTSEFWHLNMKMKIGFEKSCAIRKPRTLAGSIFNTMENQANLYTPLFVFGPGEIEWEKGRISKPELMPGANLIASQASILHKFKTEGKVYYGRDIRKVIKPKFTWWEKMKGILIPLYLSFFASLIVGAFPKRAVKYCNKAILYSIDSAVIYLNDMKKHKVEEKVNVLKNASRISITEKRQSEIMNFALSLNIQMMTAKEFDIAQEALGYKINGFPYGRVKAMWYAWRCAWFVFRINMSVIAKGIWKKIKRNNLYNKS